MNKLLLLVLLTLVSTALVGGYMAVGGPQYARFMKDDIKRLQHLHDFGRYYSCHADAAPSLDNRCSTQRRLPKHVDPVTGEAYRYTRVDENTLDVCAQFQTATDRSELKRRFRDLHFEGDEGCIRYQRRGNKNTWFLR
ncbi:MAG: hypothetical protein ABJL67_15170 [Sulfitobacter sp.]